MPGAPSLMVESLCLPLPNGGRATVVVSARVFTVMWQSRAVWLVVPVSARVAGWRIDLGPVISLIELLRSIDLL